MKLFYPLLVSFCISSLAFWYSNHQEAGIFKMMEDEKMQVDKDNKSASTNKKQHKIATPYRGAYNYNAPFATSPLITAIKTVDKTVAVAGDTLTYSVTITNSGTEDANGVTFTDNVDANTTLVNGSLVTTPVAFDDSYSSIGNVGISVPAANGVLANDNTGQPTGTLTVITNGATTSGGTVTLNADGSFDYNPAAGFTGNDSFSYTLTNSAGSGIGTVTITVSGMIWFINNGSTATAADGRLSSPFKTVTAFQALNNGTGNNPKANQNIFIYESATNYDGNITLLNNQNLIGQDATASLATITGYSIPAFSKTLPTTNSSNGINVNLTTTATATSAITLNGGGSGSYIIRGLTIGNKTGSGLTGTTFGTLTVSETNITGAGRALSLNTGTVNASFTTLSSSSGTNAVYLRSIAGSVTASGGALSGSSDTTFFVSGTASVTYPGNITQANNARLIVIGAHSSGTVTFTGSLSATNGSGIDLNNADGTYNFNGTNTLNGGDAGIDIENGSSGTVVFSSTSGITNPTGNAFDIKASSPTATYNGTISKSNAAKAIDVQNCTGGTINFTGAISSTITSSGINLATNTGCTINFTGGLNLNTGSNAAFTATGGGTVNVTQNNTTIVNTITTTTGTAITVNSTTIGLSGLTFRSVNVNGASNGIVLLTTGSSGGFTITGSGTTAGSGGALQNITNRGVSITSAKSVSLSYMNFTNANTANGTTPCDQDGLGGCNAAVYLNTISTSASLNNLTINGTAQQGIAGTDINDLTINNCTLTNNGNEVEEGALKLRDIKGNCSILNSNMSLSATRIAHIINTTSTPVHLAVTNSNFFDNSVSGIGEDCFEMRTQSSANATIVISGSSFKKAKTKGIQIFAENTSTINVGIQTSTIDRQTIDMAGIETGSDQTATLNSYIANNTKINGSLEVPVNIYSAVSSTTQAKVLNNSIDGNASIGFATLRAYAVDNASSKVQFQGNTLTNSNEQGILVHNSGSSTGTNASINSLIESNTVTIGSSINSIDAIELRAGSSTTNTTYTNINCGNVRTNTVTINNAYRAFRVRPLGSAVKVNLQGTGTTVPAIWTSNGNSYTNPPGTSVNPIAPTASTSLPTTTIFGGATCLTPSNAVPTVIVPVESPVTSLEDSSVKNLNATLATPNAPLDNHEELDTVVKEIAPVIASKSEPSTPQVTLAGETVNISSFTLPKGKSITIKFKVSVNNPFPVNVCSVSNQASISGANFATVLSDNDNNTGNGINPTVTSVNAAPVITDCDANTATSNTDANVCTATKSFSVTATGCPAPTVTYTLNGNTITSPYAFPTGVSVVTVTASNGIGTNATCSFTVTVNSASAEIATQPLTKTICEGSSTSFTVASTGSSQAYQWQVDQGSGFTNITNNTVYTGATSSTLDVASPTSVMNGYSYRVVINTCGNAAPVTSNSAILNVNSTGTWTGATSSDWNTASNWCGAVPTALSNVTIPANAPNMPALATGTVSINNLDIKAGATLSLTGGTFTINGAVNGSGVIASTSAADLVIAGTTGSAGTINFAAANNSLNNLTVNRTGAAASVTLGNQLNVYGTVTLTNGTLNTGNYLVLKSTATSTAKVAPVTGAVAGNVTVERYISSLDNRAYRLLSPSVNTSSSIRQNWQENGVLTPGYGTHITGSKSGANGFDATVTGQSSLFTYEQTTAPQAWTAIANTDATSFNAKSGYMLFVRGDRSIDLTATGNTLPSNNTTLRATGTLLTGQQQFTAQQGAGRFSLIGNPYASPISWSSIYTANNLNFENYYTYWDPNVGSRGGYVTVNNSGQKSLATNATVEIQSGQAFFVRATPGAVSPTFTIQESHKSSNNNLNLFRQGAGTEQLMTSLYYTTSDGTRRVADGVTAVYNNNYSTALAKEDAEEIANWDENIAILRDGKNLSIEGRPLIDEADTLHLNMANMKVQNYEFQFDASSFSHPNLQASLVDKFLNSRTPISLTGTTVIPFSITSNSASSVLDRFEVVFGPSSTLPVNITTVKAYKKQEGVEVNWTTSTETNIDSYKIQRSVNGHDFTEVGSVAARGNTNTSMSYDWFDATPNNGNNYYRVKALSISGEAQLTKVVRVVLGNVSGEITIFPNPVTGTNVTLQMNLEKGNYTIALVSSVGQRVFTKVIVHPGGSTMKTLELGRSLAKGVYQLQVTSGGFMYTQSLIKN